MNIYFDCFAYLSLLHSLGQMLFTFVMNPEGGRRRKMAPVAACTSLGPDGGWWWTAGESAVGRTAVRIFQPGFINLGFVIRCVNFGKLVLGP